MQWKYLRLRILVVSTLATGLLAASSAAWSQSWTKQLANGVTLTQQVIAPGETTGSPEIINALTVDPRAPGVRLQSVVAQDRVYNSDKLKGREIVSSIAKRLNAVAAVNADFFAMGTAFAGDMLNLQITNGELVSEPYPGRVVFAIASDGGFTFSKPTFAGKVLLADGRTISVKGINRPRGKNEVVLYTPRFYSSTCTPTDSAEVVVRCDSFPVKANVPIAGTVLDAKPSCGNTEIADGCVVVSGAGIAGVGVAQWMKPGDKITIQLDLKSTPDVDWSKVAEAVGGGPSLLKGGQVSIDAKDAGLDGSFMTTSHPRTAVGITADGKLIFATVDGRQTISGGMSLPQLAQMMKSQGCTDAINLDGGGSTTMATPNGVLNSPSEGTERPVANALAVFAGSSAESPSDPQISITPMTAPIESGTNCLISLVDQSTGQPLPQDAAGRAVWSTTGGMGFVDQSGRLYGIKARKGTVIARIGSRTATLPVEVIPGQPVTIDADMKSDAPNRSTLTLAAVDVNKNPAKGRKVALQVTGGVADQSEVVMASDGKSTVGITWDAPEGSPAQVTLTCGTLAPVVVKR